MSWTSSLSMKVGWATLVAVALASPAAAQVCSEPAPGLLAWWMADGNVSESQAGADATLVGGAGFGPGLVGEAFRMDGVGGGQDDRVVLPASAASGLADFTVEMWVNTTDTGDAGIFSGSNAVTPGGNELLLIHGAGGLAYVVQASSSGALGVMINDGSWHHVAMMREGSMGHLYVDGTRVDSRSVPNAPLDFGPGGLMLGQEQDCLAGCLDPNQALDGLVDELSIYDRALTAGEVAGIFDSGVAGKCQPVPPPSMDDVMARIDGLEAMLHGMSMEDEDLLVRIEGLEAELDAMRARVEQLEANATSSGGDGDVEVEECEDDRASKWKKRHDRFKEAKKRWRERHGR